MVRKKHMKIGVWAFGKKSASLTFARDFGRFQKKLIIPRRIIEKRKPKIEKGRFKELGYYEIYY